MNIIRLLGEMLRYNVLLYYIDIIGREYVVKQRAHGAEVAYRS